jgi:tRNA-binding protein
MLITCYNPAELGDILLVVVAADVSNQQVIQKEDIVQFSDPISGKPIGYNVMHASKLLPGLIGSGQIELKVQQLQILNEALQQAGFSSELVADRKPHFVVGLVKQLEVHPNSDHLQIAQVQVEKQRLVQIVCGAPNIAADQLVVVAEPGAMMPSGEIIWPGELRGVASSGMICSARELALPNAPQKRGILVLPAADYQPGMPFDLAKHQAGK